MYIVYMYTFIDLDYTHAYCTMIGMDACLWSCDQRIGIPTMGNYEYVLRI